MPARFVDQTTDVLDILQSTAEGGEIRVTLGDSRDNTGTATSAPVWGLDGFISRPNDPDDDGACQAFAVTDGNVMRVLGMRDNRFAELAGNLKPGDRAIVTDSPARIFLKRDKDMVALYTEKGDGKSMLLALNGSAGTITLAVGATQIVISENDITLAVNGGPGLSLSGITQSAALRAPACHIDGGFVTIGLQSDTQQRPIAADLPLVNAIVGPVGVLGTPSPKVWIANK